MRSGGNSRKRREQGLVEDRVGWTRSLGTDYSKGARAVSYEHNKTWARPSLVYFWPPDRTRSGHRGHRRCGRSWAREYQSRRSFQVWAVLRGAPGWWHGGQPPPPPRRGADASGPSVHTCP